ncbi:maleylpyruvate isomerase N-terminal domain-containing protein [Streptomyces microflavus]|uniref:maleylpyruvate isomerase N-terminal domain-containing protein n=1 Tax=Streptomyces microflavus TaxID=1919 RepID=UPI003F4BC64C
MPTCPEWTLFDLVQHLGEGRRALAATIAADLTPRPSPPRRATRPRLGSATPSSPWAPRSRCRTRWHSTVSRSS